MSNDSTHELPQITVSRDAIARDLERRMTKVEGHSGDFNEPHEGAICSLCGRKTSGRGMPHKKKDGAKRLVRNGWRPIGKEGVACPDCLEADLRIRPIENPEQLAEAISHLIREAAGAGKLTPGPAMIIPEGIRWIDLTGGFIDSTGATSPAPRRLIFSLTPQDLADMKADGVMLDFDDDGPRKLSLDWDLELGEGAGRSFRLMSNSINRLLAAYRKLRRCSIDCPPEIDLDSDHFGLLDGDEVVDEQIVDPVIVIGPDVEKAMLERHAVIACIGAEGDKPASVVVTFNEGERRVRAESLRMAIARFSMAVSGIGKMDWVETIDPPERDARLERHGRDYYRRIVEEVRDIFVGVNGRKGDIYLGTPDEPMDGLQEAARKLMAELRQRVSRGSESDVESARLQSEILRLEDLCRSKEASMAGMAQNIAELERQIDAGRTREAELQDEIVLLREVREAQANSILQHSRNAVRDEKLRAKLGEENADLRLRIIELEDETFRPAEDDDSDEGGDREIWALRELAHRCESSGDKVIGKCSLCKSETPIASGALEAAKWMRDCRWGVLGGGLICFECARTAAAATRNKRTAWIDDGIVDTVLKYVGRRPPGAPDLDPRFRWDCVGCGCHYSSWSIDAVTAARKCIGAGWELARGRAGMLCPMCFHKVMVGRSEEAREIDAAIERAEAAVLADEVDRAITDPKESPLQLLGRLVNEHGGELDARIHAFDKIMEAFTLDGELIPGWDGDMLVPYVVAVVREYLEATVNKGKAYHPAAEAKPSDRQTLIDAVRRLTDMQIADVSDELAELHKAAGIYGADDQPDDVPFVVSGDRLQKAVAAFEAKLGANKGPGLAVFYVPFNRKPVRVVDRRDANSERRMEIALRQEIGYIGADRILFLLSNALRNVGKSDLAQRNADAIRDLAKQLAGAADSLGDLGELHDETTKSNDDEQVPSEAMADSIERAHIAAASAMPTLTIPGVSFAIDLTDAVNTLLDVGTRLRHFIIELGAWAHGSIRDFDPSADGYAARCEAATEDLADAISKILDASGNIEQPGCGLFRFHTDPDDPNSIEFRRDELARKTPTPTQNNLRAFGELFRRRSKPETGPDGGFLIPPAASAAIMNAWKEGRSIVIPISIGDARVVEASWEPTGLDHYPGAVRDNHSKEPAEEPEIEPIPPENFQPWDCGLCGSHEIEYSRKARICPSCLERLMCEDCVDAGVAQGFQPGELECKACDADNDLPGNAFGHEWTNTSERLTFDAGMYRARYCTGSAENDREFEQRITAWEKADTRCVVQVCAHCESIRAMVPNGGVNFYDSKARDNRTPRHPGCSQ